MCVVYAHYIIEEIIMVNVGAVVVGAPFADCTVD